MKLPCSVAPCTPMEYGRPASPSTPDIAGLDWFSRFDTTESIRAARYLDLNLSCFSYTPQQRMIPGIVLEGVARANQRGTSCLNSMVHGIAVTLEDADINGCFTASQTYRFLASRRHDYFPEIRSTPVAERTSVSTMIRSTAHGMRHWCVIEHDCARCPRPGTIRYVEVSSVPHLKPSARQRSSWAVCRNSKKGMELSGAGKSLKHRRPVFTPEQHASSYQALIWREDLSMIGSSSSRCWSREMKMKNDSHESEAPGELESAVGKRQRPRSTDPARRFGAPVSQSSKSVLKIEPARNGFVSVVNGLSYTTSTPEIEHELNGSCLDLALCLCYLICKHG
jgi:hypothetical protein